jgi:arylsulfatase A-like enzyme
VIPIDSRYQNGSRSLADKASEAAIDHAGKGPTPSIFLIAWVVVLVSSCSAPEHPPLMRFIEAQPREYLTANALTSGEPAFTWRFEDAQDLAPFERLSPDGRYEVRDGTLVVSAVGPDPFLVRPVDFEAATVDRIEIQMSAPARSPSQVLWAGADERFSADRAIRPLSTDAAQGSLVFDVSSHALWDGRIRQLRIDPASSANQTVEIRQIEAVRFRTRPDLVARAATLPWKLEIDNEVRNVLISAPDTPIQRDVEIPPDTDLHFGIAMWKVTGGAADPVQFRVTFVASDGRPRILFEHSIDPALDDATPWRWQDHKVDLAAFQGESGRIVLEAQSESPGSLTSLPVWANPELVRRDDSSRRPNVILISIDTLRADRLSTYGYQKPISEEIANWAANGVVFQNAVAAAPWTLPSHVSMFTGLDAVHHGVNYEGPASASFMMLAEHLRNAGYATGAITGGAYVGPRYGFDQGFDTYRYWSESILYGEDRELANNLAQAFRYIRAHADRQFFLFFHTYEVHAPYRPRPPYSGSFMNDDADGLVQLHPIEPDLADGFVSRVEPRWHDTATRTEEALPLSSTVASDLYDAGVAYTDAQLGGLFRLLRELELDSDTLVVLTSDHGELLGEHGSFGHLTLYDEVLLVPLIFVLPGRIDGALEVETQSRSIDILPTILELLDLPEAANIDGASLVPLMSDNLAKHPDEAWSYVPKTNVGMSLRIANQTKFIFNNAALPPIAGNQQLYDLRIDPDEMQNLAASSDLTQSLRARVVERSPDQVGLRLILRNAGPEEFVGVIEAQGVHPTKIKSVDCTAGCVTWERGRVHFAVAPGDSFTLIVEDVGEADLRLRSHLRANPGETFDLLIATASEERAWGMSYGEGGWTALGFADPLPATGIVVETQGLELEFTAGGELDPETRRQLRALGYIRN